MKEVKIEAWIKAGYALLASEGLAGIKVEHVAHNLGLNKSGFYYYFGDMKGFIKSLLQHHVSIAKEIGQEIRKCKVIDPDLLDLIIRHKLFFLVESQLLLNTKSGSNDDDLEQAAHIIGQEFLPLWKKTIKLPEDSTLAQAYLNIILHFFYARINSDNINSPFLRQLASETMNVLNEVAKEKYGWSQRLERNPD